MARRRRQGLTEKHKRILEVLEHYTDKNGYPPSIREICSRANISSTSVANYYLDRLEELGYIERDRRVSRGLRLVKSLSATADMATAQLQKTAQAVKDAVDELLTIPLIGRVVASAPVPLPPSDFNYYDAESVVNIAKSMLPRREKNASDLFALEVEGDSMIDAMVNDGDIVIMRRAQEARNGEMVAVWLNDKDETTLKYFYLENGRVRLQPANPTMEPIFIDDPRTVEIQGKVVMVVRQMDVQ